ncbi:MAG: nucleotide-diphosphate-sugar epimerase [Betaproteobacteria bacterium]|nr:MAG: nucleotide-diphosphate-sugar epimerase [Betaproteobacteria bacterium]
MSRPTIVVFGATGRAGSALVRAALADPQRRFHVRAATRQPSGEAAGALARAGAEVVHADLDAAATVVRAMQGAHGAYCTAAYWEHRTPERTLAQAHTLAWAAARAGVAHVVWSTAEDTREFAPPGTTMPVLHGRYAVPAFDALGEANHAFVEPAVPTTLLYPALAWEDLVRLGLRRGPAGAHTLLLPFGASRFAGIAGDDIGACTLAIFAAGDDAIGKAIGIAGEHLTGRQMADQLALALRAPVAHAPATRAACAQLDLPGADEIANLFQFQHDFEHAYLRARSLACARELHPGLMSFAAWLARRRRALPRATREAFA